jgi:hypothetical protein
MWSETYLLRLETFGSFVPDVGGARFGAVAAFGVVFDVGLVVMLDMV